MKKTILGMLALMLTGCSGSSAKYSMTLDELPQHLTLVNLTVDNWEDYFEIVQTEKEAVENGQPVRNGSVEVIAKDDQLFLISNDARIDFSYDEIYYRYTRDDNGQFADDIYQDDSQTREQTATVDSIGAYVVNYSIGELSGADEQITCYNFEAEQEYPCHAFSEHRIENVTATNASGSIYLLNIAEDKWFINDEGEKYFAILDENQKLVYRYYLNGYTETCEVDGTVVGDNQAFIDMLVPLKDTFTFSQNQYNNFTWSLLTMINQ